MPIKSMTAFGSGEMQDEGSNYICEVKSLNSRFIEVNVRLPRFLGALETDVIAKVKETLYRGKVDVSFMIQLKEQSSNLPRLNEAALDNYLKIIATAQKKSGVKESPDLVRMLQLEGVLEAPNTDKSLDVASRHRKGLLAALEQALKGLDQGRKQEGDALAKEFMKLLGEIAASRQAIEGMAGEISKATYETYVERLENLQRKMSESGLKTAAELPEDRLLLEVGILIDKSDINEELTRLKAHEDEFKRLLQASCKEGAGRRLDFLCQEMQREVNTISNKLIQTQASAHSRNMKHTIEKIKQQIQNIE